MLAAVPLLAGTAGGLLLVDGIPQHLVLASAAAAVFALIAGCGFLALRYDVAVLLAIGIGCAGAGVCAGASSARYLYRTPLVEWSHANVGDAADPFTVVGILREDGSVTDYGASLTVDAVTICAGRCGDSHSEVPVAGGLRLSVGGAVSHGDVRRWRAGRMVRLPALLRAPASFRNPGIPDEARAQARRGIALVGSVKSAALVEVVAPASRLGEAAADVRAWSRRVLSRHVARLSERSTAIATAILIGDRTGLSDEDERRLQDAGTFHVIAISGGNIAVFTAMLLIGARLCRVPFRAAALLTIVLLLFYAEVAGGAPSVSRAVSAAVVFLVARALDHRGAPLNTVAVAAILGSAASPAIVVDPGFLLSFVATAAIVLGVPRLLPVHGQRRWMATMPAATLCAEIALAPIAATLFSRLTAAGLIVNFAAIPLMTVVQVGSLSLLAVSGFSASWADRLAVIVHWSADGLVDSARFVELAPWMARHASAPAWWVCGIYYMACLGLLGPKTRRPSAIVLAISIFLLVAGLPTTARGLVPLPSPGVLRVVVLDVGQGDATVAILPDGTVVAIDAGGLAGTTFDVARRVVLPSWRALQVTALHALVLTHADPDHVGGADGVLREFAPSQIWEGVPVPPHPVLRALRARAAAQRTVWRTVRPGDIDRAGNVEIKVLHPPEPEWERQRVRNDDSVVLELRYGDVSIVLPGDIGREVERALIPSLHLGRTVILKAAHHGSATSSGDEFLDATKPQAVIFSAGKNNRFGHPAKAVVERVARRGVAMFNTAQDGAVFVETDGRSVRVWGWASRSVTTIH